MTPFLRMLARYGTLTAGDIQAVEALHLEETTREAGHQVYEEGRPSGSAYLLLSGLACCYRDLPDGGRQISDILIPGDLCGIHAFLGGPMDHSAMTVTRTRFLVVGNAAMASLTGNPRVATTLLRISREKAVELRTRLSAIGRMDARARVACLIGELHARFGDAQPGRETVLRLPLTQAMVADMLGLTPVHVGRVLRRMHEERMVRLERGGFVVLRPDSIRDASGLEREASFPAAWNRVPDSVPGMTGRAHRGGAGDRSLGA